MMIRAALVRAAHSRRTLHAGIWLNALAAAAAALAANWGIAREHLPWHVWLIGLAVLAGVNVALHGSQLRAADRGAQ